MTTNDVIKKFDKDIKNWRSEKRSFWEHTILINATILGFSVATSQIGNIVEPNIFLVLAWIFLLLSILIGILLLRQDQDIKISSDIKNFEINYDLTQIEDLFNSNKITKTQRDGMIIAAYYKTGINDLLIKEGSKFSPYAMELVQKYTSDLPSSKILKDIPKTNNIVGKLFEQLKHLITIDYLKLSSWNYCFIIGAYTSLLLSVLTGPYVKSLLYKIFSLIGLIYSIINTLP